jgi:hypothetical protein
MSEREKPLIGKPAGKKEKSIKNTICDMVANRRKKTLPAREGSSLAKNE